MKKPKRVIPERRGLLVRRPVDRRRVDIALTVEDAAQAGLALAWAAGIMRTIPDMGLGSSGFLSFPAAAVQCERVASVLREAIADVVDPEGAKKQLELEESAS